MSAGVSVLQLGARADSLCQHPSAACMLAAAIVSVRIGVCWPGDGPQPSFKRGALAVADCLRPLLSLSNRREATASAQLSEQDRGRKPSGLLLGATIAPRDAPLARGWLGTADVGSTRSLCIAGPLRKQQPVWCGFRRAAGSGPCSPCSSRIGTPQWRVLVLARTGRVVIVPQAADHPCCKEQPSATHPNSIPTRLQPYFPQAFSPPSPPLKRIPPNGAPRSALQPALALLENAAEWRAKQGLTSSNGGQPTFPRVTCIKLGNPPFPPTSAVCLHARRHGQSARAQPPQSFARPHWRSCTVRWCLARGDGDGEGADPTRRRW